MSPALNGSSAIRHFKHSNANEICNRITLDFYTVLPHMSHVGDVLWMYVCVYLDMCMCACAVYLDMCMCVHVLCVLHVDMCMCVCVCVVCALLDNFTTSTLSSLSGAASPTATSDPTRPSQKATASDPTRQSPKTATAPARPSTKTAKLPATAPTPTQLSAFS